MRVKLPTEFKIEYPSENRAYYTGGEKSKQIIGALLKNASNYYCMYCGVALEIEGMDLSQVEHSVDKAGNMKQTGRTPLTNCKYNLALACKDCNMKYKKNVIKVDLLNRFKKKCPKNCVKPCDDYQELRQEYIVQNQIILQPEGVRDDKGSYEIKYDIFKHIYVPGTEDSTKSAFIQQHIHRFHLNREKFSYSIIEVCSDIVELNELGLDSTEALLMYIGKQKQENIIGKLFIDYLIRTFSKRNMNDLLSFCRKVVICSALI